MHSSFFATNQPRVADNANLRTPQREAYEAIVDYASGAPPSDREVSVILPVGCGKSGCIALAPFAVKAHRALVVGPNLTITEQLVKEFDPASDEMFYAKTATLQAPITIEPVRLSGDASNRDDLDHADVVITNIQQLQGDENRWLNDLPSDFFDVILFDEGHHNVASTWDNVKAKFPNARIISLTATPHRADGQRMTGRVIYSYPVHRAIEEGYIKRLSAVVLNPRTLRFVRRQDGAEVEVTLEEVRRLGEEEADFRRSIVTSKETLDTIVDASIRELRSKRTASGDDRLAIIASALNYEHCRQIVEAYQSRNLKAGYVHSRENGVANDRVKQRLHRHDLDVIVQVRKLGEGFDHPHLAVAAVFSIFANLSPFVQFVGRIMRVIKQNDSSGSSESWHSRVSRRSERR